MKTSTITHFFDVIKKEIIPESEATTSITNNEPVWNINFKQDYVKEEVDIPWDETSYIVAKDQDVYLSGKDMFNARVIIEKLPDIIVQKHFKKKRKMIESHKNSTKECISSNIVPKSSTTTTRTNFRNDKISNGIDKENGSAPYWKTCTKCNKRYEIYRHKRLRNGCRECKTPLIFECKKCHKQMSTTGNLKHHINFRCVHRRYYYKCSECDFKAGHRFSIKNHVRKEHPTMSSQMHCIEIIESNNVQNDLDNARNKKFKCLTCEKNFQFLSTLMRHCQICTGKEGTIKNEYQSPVEDLPQSVRRRMMVYCSECDKDVVYDNNTLKSDRLFKKLCPDCKSIMAYKCSECKKQYVSRHGLASHIRSVHTSQQEYKCPECDYKSSVLEHLCNHYRINHITGIHVCSKCDKKFYKPIQLYGHSRRCGLEPPYNCDHCSFKSYYKKTMINHMLERHSTGHEMDCLKCKRTFKNKSSLKVHRTLCGEERNLKCNHCSFKTKCRQSINQHVLRMHSISKEIECPNCKKMLRNKLCFKEHFKLCSIKNLQCNFCSFKTKSPPTLSYHTWRLHAEGKNISSVIGKSGKQYHCNHCSYKCKVTVDIYHHIVKNHLKEKNIKCPRCSAKFQSNVYLDQHLLHCKNLSFKPCTGKDN